MKTKPQRKLEELFRELLKIRLSLGPPASLIRHWRRDDYLPLAVDSIYK